MRALALIALLAAASCGSNVVASEPAPLTDSGFDLGPQPASAYCPPKEPVAGSECPWRYHSCSYGDSPVPDCRRSYWCTVGRTEEGQLWVEERGGCTDATSGCPAARPAAGAACETRHSQGCAYPDAALCFCAPTDAGNAWSCVVPAPECPRIIPNMGTECTTPMDCSYGIGVSRCVWGATAACAGGHWRWSSGCAE